MKKSLLLFLFVSFLCCSAASVRAEDPLLKIQTSQDQTSVKSGMMFLVRAQVANTSADTSTEFWANSCSYEKHWVTDNPGVFIQSWTCDENTLEQVDLEPGDIYEKNIILYIPKKDKTEPVTFRLGFKRMSENGDVAEPLWSDPVTMQVIVPDEMKEAVPAVDAGASPVGQKPVSSAEVVAKEPVPQDADAEASVTPTEASLVFQDPGVPIQVDPGAEFSIALASNPSTGFRWKMTLPEDDKVVAFLGSEHVVSAEVMPGVPGTELFKFKAVTPGGTNAAFVYERPWETVTAPTRKIFTIVVQEA